MQRTEGFSVIELLVVVSIVAVLTAAAVYSVNNLFKYSTDRQARAMADVFDEARQKALNQRNTFRVEINKTRNRLVLIDENSPSTASDDVIVRTVPLRNDVAIGTRPNNVAANPTSTSPIPLASFRTSNYPLSSGDQKITLRFRRNGQVVDEGSDSIGTNSIVTGSTIYVYSTREGINAPSDVRAVTVLGTTGDTAVQGCRFDSQMRCTAWVRL